MTLPLEASPPAYVPRDPSQTVLYRVVADPLETFLASLDTDPNAQGLPAYYVNKAVTRGLARADVQPGSVTFIQRFESVIHLHVYYHGVFLEGGLSRSH
jgi:hypothetical protein